MNKNAQSNGDHEVHAEGCVYMPAPANEVYLGEFTSCQDAVKEAKRQYTQVNGCRTVHRPAISLKPGSVGIQKAELPFPILRTLSIIRVERPINCTFQLMCCIY